MERLDYSLNAYKSKPSHVIVAVDTRREIARVHHEEDLQDILRVCNAHEGLVKALEMAKKLLSDPNLMPSTADIIQINHALAAAKGE